RPRGARPVPAADPQARPRRHREGREGPVKNFTYHQPATVQQALPLLDEQWGKTELLAGGTDLLDRQKEYVSQPDKVVSLTGIGGEFREISAIGPAVTIGA